MKDQEREHGRITMADLPGMQATSPNGYQISGRELQGPRLTFLYIDLM